MTRDNDKLDICRKLSREAYKKKIQENIDGWIGIDEKQFNEKCWFTLLQRLNPYQKGHFACVAYKNDQRKEIIIAFRGTNDPLDVITDSFFITKETPPSLNSAREAYDKLKKQYLDFDFYFTGHSLGGAYAQLLCHQLKNEGVFCHALTFNAPGVAYAMDRPEENKDLEKLIDNYVIMNDFVGNYRQHMGKTHYIQPYPFDKPDPENTEKNQTPHGAILLYNEREFGPIIKDLNGFRKENAWALWFYDTKNTDSQNKIFKPIINFAIEPHNLTDAISIIKDNKIEILNKFEYDVNQVGYYLP